MKAIVTLDLFSGMPNPRWELSTADLMRFQELLTTLPPIAVGTPFAPAFAATDESVRPDNMLIRDALKVGYGQHIAPPEAIGDETDVLLRPESGFRGFRIAFTDHDQSVVIESFNRLILETNTGQVRQDDATETFEQQLYATCPISVLEQQLAGMTYAQLQIAGNETTIDGLEGPDIGLQCGSSTPYTGNVGPWKTHVLDNNCYNYATDTLAVPPADPAVPGRGARLESHPLTDEALRAALDEDQLENLRSRLPTTCPPDGGHYLVVLIREHPATHLVRDFHCVRLDRNGIWSHKDGRGGVRNHDDARHLMTDLTQARFRWTPRLIGVYLARYSKRGLID